MTEADSDLYWSFDWCRLWWAHYGAGRTLRLLAFWSGDRLVGLMPMVVERGGLPGARVRLAKIVGSDSTITVLRPAIAAGWHARVASATITQMIDAERCDGVWFGPLSGEGEGANAFRSACSSHSSVVLARDKSPGVHSVFLLPETSSEYMASLDKKVRDNHRRTMNQLSKGRSVAHVLVGQPEHVGGCFDEFLRMHERQWNAVNKPGHFGDWPRSEEFTRDLIEQLAPMGRVVFMHLIADGTTLSRMHSLRMGRHLHWRMPARELGTAWDRLSIGNLALVMSIEAAIGSGITRLEGGPGHYESKVRHGSMEFPVASFLAVRRRAGSRNRAKLMCALADLLHLLYYRVWRIKLAPLIVRRQRPLWQSWIRSRL